MSASDALQPRLFHGARNQVNDTHIRPPSETGVHAYASVGYSHGRHERPHTELAFATELEHSAWQYAHNGAYHHADSAVNHDPDPKHRSRVYEVEPAHDQKGGPGETFTPTGFRIKAEHQSAPGATSTFHELNWNAFKAPPKKGSPFVDSGDKNHSYMEVDHRAEQAKRDNPPVHPVKEGLDEYSNRYRVDSRHPDQLNLFSGKTVHEHRLYEATAGVVQHLHPGQFENVAFHRDPTTSVIRAAKQYHRADTEFGTVHA